jgi:hypothetical protein
LRVRYGSERKQKPETGRVELALSTGNWNWNWQLETGNWKLETGNWKLETGNWKLIHPLPPDTCFAIA